MHFPWSTRSVFARDRREFQRLLDLEALFGAWHNALKQAPQRQNSPWKHVWDNFQPLAPVSPESLEDWIFDSEPMEWLSEFRFWIVERQANALSALKKALSAPASASPSPKLEWAKWEWIDAWLKEVSFQEGRNIAKKTCIPPIHSPFRLHKTYWIEALRATPFFPAQSLNSNEIWLRQRQQDLHLKWLNCSHHYVQPSEPSKWLCMLHYYWIRGYFYELDPRIQTQLIQSTETPQGGGNRCQLKVWVC